MNITFVGLGKCWRATASEYKVKGPLAALTSRIINKQIADAEDFRHFLATY